VYCSSNNIKQILEDTFKGENFINDIKDVYFYGAGCTHYIYAENIIESFRSKFTSANIVVKSDIYAAAVSLFKQSAGVAIILGTGSNICKYDGKDVISTRSGIGYILGDEGSGANIGKLLIQDYLNGFMDDDIVKLFELKYKLNLGDIISSVYSNPNPNLFLSKFSKFIYENIDNSYLRNLVRKSFVSLFEVHLLHINKSKGLKLGFVGSVAFYFNDILQEVTQMYGMEISEVLKKPIEGLIDYHSITSQE